MTPRDISVIKFVADYYTVTRRQITVACFPDDIKGDSRDGRMTRKRLRALLQQGLINRTHAEVFNPQGGAGAPVYFPTTKGAELLAAELGDEKYLHICCLTPNWQHLRHWTTIAEFHIILDQAIAKQNEVCVEGWLHEWDVANPDERNPEKRYRLFTLLREKPRLVCAPDAAFLLSFKGYKRVYYLEIDRGTSGIQQIANSKTPGYAAMGDRHLQHFPQSNMSTFTVLNIVPKSGRRDLLRSAIRDKDGASLWKFVSWEDIRPESMLFDSILFDCEKGPFPLVKRGSA